MRKLARIDVFGGLNATVDGVAWQVLSARPSALLALLVLARGRPVGQTELVEWLWGDDAVPSAGNQLQRMVGQLRRRFEPALPARSSGQVILAVDDGYRLGDAVASDLFDLDRQMADPAAVATHRHDLLRVVRLPPFAGLEPTLADHPSYVAVERQCASLAIDALDLADDGDQDPEIVDLVQAVAVRFPFEERLQARLVRALGVVGRRSEAMALYDRVRSSLRDELGVDPGPDLQAAHHDVLSLDRPAAGAPKGVAQLPRVVGGLVNRPHAQQLLDRVADAGRAEAVLVTAIGGMGGVGKTTLAVAWAHQLAPRFPDGQLYLNLRGFDAQGDVMTSEDALGMLLTTLGAAADEEPGVEARSARLRSCLAGRRYLMLLDNARDADQVRPLLPGDPGCLAIVTSRNRLTSLVTREGAVPIHLDRMTDDEAEELLARRLGTEALRADQTATRSVLRACDGLPLALALVATRVAIEPLLTLTDIARDLEEVDLAAWSTDVGSEDLRSVFAWSFAALDQATVDAFQLIGAHPAPRMSMASLVSLLGRRREECAHTVRELCDANLLQQVDRDHFALHDLLRMYAQAMPDPAHRVPEAERRLVNHFVQTARNAETTLGLTHSRPREDVAQGVAPESFASAAPAHDWYRAESEAISAVIGLALRTGSTRAAANIAMDMRTVAQPFTSSRRRAQVVHDVLAAADGLTSDDAFGDRALLGDALRVIAADRLWYQEPDAAEPSLARAERLLRDAGDPLALCQVVRTVGRLHQERGDFPAALEAYQRALVMADDADAIPLQTVLLLEMSHLHLVQGDWAAALDATDRAISIESQQRSEGSVLALAYTNRAEALLGLHRFDEALAAHDVGAAIDVGGARLTLSYLGLRARITLAIGDVAGAQQAIDQFRSLVASKSGAELSESYSVEVDLFAVIAEVERAVAELSGH